MKSNTPSLLALALLACSAGSQSAELAPVTVTARVPDATTQVFEHDDLARFGDADMNTVLRRLPGVQIDSEGRIQLRGMGNGYTRIELNGQPLGSQGAGAALDNIPVDLVERVEVVRGASASSSGEAVAGTILITTREAHGEDRLRLKTTLGAEGGQPTEALGLAWSGHSGAVDYQLTASLGQRRWTGQTLRRSRGVAEDGTLYMTEVEDKRSPGRSEALTLAPQLVWRASGQDTLKLSALVDSSRTRTTSYSTLDHQADFPADYARIEEPDRERSTSLNPQAQWLHRWDNGDRFTLDAGGRLQNRRETYLWQSFDADNAVVDTDDTRTRQRQSGSNLGLTWDMAASSKLRWVFGSKINTETRRNADVENGDASHDSVRRRQWAGFAQTQWQLAPGWRLDSGLRYERTQLKISSDDSTRNGQDGIWLPSATLAWQMDPQRTWHLNAGRTYRAPRLKDLSPGGRTTSWNVPSNPDQRGNPELQAERAVGVDAGLRQMLGADGALGEVGINLFSRRVQQLIQYQLRYTDAERWLLAPVNAGNARVQGLELDGRWDLQQWVKDLPVELRANLSLYRSRLDGVAAPDGLPGQPTALLNLGFDVRNGAFSWGGNFNATPGYDVRGGPVQTVHIGVQRSVDAYAQWAFDRSTRLRLNASHLGRGVYRSLSTTAVGTNNDTQTDDVRQKMLWTTALSLEKDF